MLAALAAVVVCLSFNAGPAHAENPCNSPDPPPTCGGGSTTTTEYKDVTLTVEVPAVGGHVISTPAGVDCWATCTKTVTVSRACIDGECGPWSTRSYTLSAEGSPPGYAAAWSGCTNNTATCDVTFDANKTVTLTWKDVTRPTIAFDPPAKGSAATALTASAIDNSGAVRYMFWVIDGTAKPSVDGSSLTLSLGELSEDDHQISVGAVDWSGNTTMTAKTVAVDKSVKLSLGDLPAFTNAASVPLTFTTDADVPEEQITCGLNNDPQFRCASPYSPVDASSPDGTYTYLVAVMDDVKNSTSATKSFVLDRTLPAVSLTGGPAEGQVLTTPSATLTFTATDANLGAVTCKVDGGAFGACSSPLALSGLTAGAHTVTVRAVDKAGNAREVTRTFTYKAPTTNPGEKPGGEKPGGEQPGVTQRPVLVVRAKAAKRVTTIKALQLKRLPKGAKVTITCRGKGCARKKLVLRRAAGGVLQVKAVKGRKLRPGAKLTVKVTAPGLAAYARTVAIRAGKAPLVRA